MRRGHKPNPQNERFHLAVERGEVDWSLRNVVLCKIYGATPASVRGVRNGRGAQHVKSGRPERDYGEVDWTKTYAEIGKQLGVSRSRAYRIALKLGKTKS